MHIERYFCRRNVKIKIPHHVQSTNNSKIGWLLGTIPLCCISSFISTRTVSILYLAQRRFSNQWLWRFVPTIRTENCVWVFSLGKKSTCKCLPSYFFFRRAFTSVTVVMFVGNTSRYPLGSAHRPQSCQIRFKSKYLVTSFSRFCVLKSF